MKRLIWISILILCASTCNKAHAFYEDDLYDSLVVVTTGATVVGSTGTVFFFDAFTAGGNTALESWTPVPGPGAAWSVKGDNASATVNSADGAIANEGTGSIALESNAAPANANYACAISAKTGSTGANDRFALRCRVASAEADYYQLDVRGDTGAWGLRSAIASVETTLASGSIGAFAAATFYKFQITMVGNQIQAFIDDVSVANVTDNTPGPTATGSIGAFMRETNARITWMGGWQ